MASTAESVRMEMQNIVRMASEPMHPGDNVKALITRSAIRLGLQAARVKRLWYGEVGTIPAHEADRLRAAKRRLLRDRQNALKVEIDQLQMVLDAWE